MSFFEKIPAAQPPQPAPRQPEWSGPPENVVGATVPFDLVLVNTGQIAVTVGSMTAYPTGVSFELRILRRTPTPEDALWRMHHPGPGGLRLGIELPDGSRVVSDRGPHAPGKGPTLTPGGGSGGPLRQEQSYWLWPLPPAGPLRFACAWPDEGIDEAVAEIDAPIREAAERAVELWPDERPVGDEW
jgi:hypothetical protein